MTEEVTPVRQNRVLTNTLTFSTDMEALFVVDNGKVSSYDLTHPNGIFIGTVRGQVTAGTAERVPEESDVVQKVTLNLQKAHWTVAYRRPTQTLNVIGATDIDLGLMSDKEGRASVHRFPIGGNVVHVQRSENSITIRLIKA